MITQQYSRFRKLKGLNRDSGEEAKEKIWGGGNLRYGSGEVWIPCPPALPPSESWPILRNLINSFGQNLKTKTKHCAQSLSSKHKM